MAVMLLSRAGAGKTARVQDALLQLKTEQPLAKVWVLLSTERQIYDFRSRFTARGRVFFNVEYFNFYALYKRVLATARQPGRVLPQPTRDALIRALLRQQFSTSPVFGKIAGTPGLAQAVAGLVDELKQHRIMPDAFAEAAHNVREAELAAIYAAYLQLLRDNDLIDREGEGWLAIEALQANAHLVQDVDLLIVDGYDQFNPLQAALLAELDKQVKAMLITLTTVVGREGTIGRRFQRARDRLHRAFEGRLIEDETDLVLSPRPAAVQQLLDRLLLPSSVSPAYADHLKPTPAASASTHSDPFAVAWIEAPDPSSEAAAVMRRIKGLLLEDSRPDDVLIAVRDWGTYGGHLTTYARLYGIPMALHYGTAPERNPAVAALIDLLALHQNGFRRREVLDVLRSPYFDVPGLPAEAVDLLDRISREARVIGGRDEWADALRFSVASEDRQTHAPEDDEDAGSGSRLRLEDAEAMYWALMAFFDAVTPPETGTTEEYVRWLEALIGHDIPDPDDGAAGNVNS